MSVCGKKIEFKVISLKSFSKAVYAAADLSCGTDMANKLLIFFLIYFAHFFTRFYKVMSEAAKQGANHQEWKHILYKALHDISLLSHFHKCW